MTTIDIERAYRALCETMGPVQGWEQIEPAHQPIPRCMVELERQQLEAEAAHDLACTVHEQAFTDASRENMEIARAKLQEIVDRLACLRWVWLNHPEWIEE